MTFSCSHHREPFESPSAPFCRVCANVRTILQKHRREEKRINEGRLYTLGQRIARGLA